MKIYLWIVFGLLYACEGRAGFHITGKCENVAAAKTVYLIAGSDTLAKSEVKSGEFEMKGEVNGLRPAYLLMNETGKKIPLFLENGKFDVMISEEEGVVRGGYYQERWVCFQKEQSTLRMKKDSLRQELDKAYRSDNRFSVMVVRAEIMVQDSINEASEDRFIATNNNVMAAYVLRSRLTELLNRKLFKAKYELLLDSARSSEIGVELYPYYANQQKTAIGSIAPDFTLNTPDGEPLSLHGLKAKVKILDFWASWCGPCRAENPHVVRLYEKYKDAGLEILSVSLDSKKEPWVKAIEKDGLPWKHVSDLKGWECSAAALYGVKSVPYLVVLDQDNRIVGNQLRGEELDECLEQLFSK